MNELPPIGPGMVSQRRCCDCGGRLEVNDGERCGDCRPQLSIKAEHIGQLRQQRHDELQVLKLAVADLENIIRRIDRRLDTYGHHSPKGHRRYPR